MIDFNQVAILGNELEYIRKAYTNNHISGDGEFTKKCHAYLQDSLGVPKALLTTSCTHALEMSAILLNLQAGDEIIAPSFTFVTSVNAFLLHGANPDHPAYKSHRPGSLCRGELRNGYHFSHRKETQFESR